MPNYQQTGMAHTWLLLNKWWLDPVVEKIVDTNVALFLEMWYWPTKMAVGASSLDFSVWPNAKVVESLYTTNLCRPQTNASKT